ncbi:B12-binding domain-containing radical SAM protein [Myxococcota bacterium]
MHPSSSSGARVPTDDARRLLYLINPFNPLISITNVKDNSWNQYRVWKPLGLLVVAGQTPPEWQVKVIDENLGVPDYASMPRPDAVGITAFTSQASRAYEVAAEFRGRGIPVMMGGIHATMRPEEASEHVDSVVTGEAENVWPEVLADLRRNSLKPTYAGTYADMDQVPAARHDLLPIGYRFGSIQVSRGCPLNCTFCSVTKFNGRHHRQRPPEKVIEELRLVRENLILIVDDNLIGTNREQIARSKELFRAMAAANLGKKWMCQVTINAADDDELLRLAAESGCFGMFIGFESPTAEGLDEVGKKFNIKKGRDLRAAVRRIHQHGIMVAGSFVLGLDVDQKGIGRRIAQAGNEYGVDLLNVLFLTPLPGTRLWETMEAEGRIIANRFPEDWKYYTLTFPVATYRHLAWSEMLQEMNASSRAFYTYRDILRRTVANLGRKGGLFRAWVTLATSLSFKFNDSIDTQAYRSLDLARGEALLSRGEHAARCDN